MFVSSVLNVNFIQNIISGFIGVYIAGYILELTGSWSAVFNVTALINFIGLIIFILFGSGNPIV